MSHPFIFARTTPDKPAVILTPSMRQISYRELEESANRTAHLFRSLGLQRGDNVAVVLENCLEIFSIASAADRAGLYITTISTHLTAEETEYIIRDSETKLVFTSPQAGTVVEQIAARLQDLPLYMTRDAKVPFRDWSAEAAQFPATPIADEAAGGYMLYSSGTTGRPKGIKRPLPDTGIMTQPMIAPLLTQVYGADQDTVYLNPAPLYHASPLGWTMMVHRVGGTVIVMEKFDAAEALKAIEQFKVTIAQFVPTHFNRLLRLPDDVRARYDVSSLKCVFHAASPCPVPVKEAMLDWWGPIIHEFYAGTEGNGITAITPHEWREKKGSVGRALGCQIFACGEDGEPVASGEEGLIYFAGGSTFEYHNDPAKTMESRNHHGWSTLGDVGRIDEDGFLFLTDRKSFMIISGGVNIYPQEIESLLVTHPRVKDVAVIGAPDQDMGEKVVAVVEPADPDDAGEELAEELRLFCRQHLSGVKVPRKFDFIDVLPRLPTGKLSKRDLRERYWTK
ncbi:acyl-CoA synthetase [Sphingobium sp. B2]|uniref:acyl-CoA synthetase n=1 Tax=Sphingobium sp. B2 TaxID=2583228 RepID=UPI00119FCE5F|nr:acyl-CoA synthetase [Sphingobium sp. B2]